MRARSSCRAVERADAHRMPIGCVAGLLQHATEQPLEKKEKLSAERYRTTEPHGGLAGCLSNPETEVR